LYPTGCIITYRAYSANEVYEIVDEENDQGGLGVQAKLCKVKTFPEPDNRRPEGGMHILKSIPTGEFKPANFVQGNRNNGYKVICLTHFRWTEGAE